MRLAAQPHQLSHSLLSRTNFPSRCLALIIIQHLFDSRLVIYAWRSHSVSRLALLAL